MFPLILQNIDLLSVGITISAMVILGFVIFFNNRTNITNQTFLLLSLAAIFYSIFNYLIFQTNSLELALWLLRLTVFFATWYAFFFFQFLYVFPLEKKTFPNWYKFGLLPLVIITAAFTLTPLVFSNILQISQVNELNIPTVINGPAIPLFGALTTSLVIIGISLFTIKMWQVKSLLKRQFLFIFIGSLITFPLYIVFNFILPVIFDNPRFVPLAAVFTLPFIFFTSYAILRHKLFNIKVVGIAILVFLLSIVTFFEVVLVREINLIIYHLSIFILILSLGILLIRGVMKEVEQKEKLTELNQKLQLEYEKADKLSKFKSEFISIASHQLRTPLTAIKGYISMIIDETYGRLTKEAKKPMEDVYKSNERLIKLVNDLLNLSKLEAGKIEFEPSPHSLEKIVNEVVDELRINAQKKNLNIKIEKTEDLPETLIDKDKIRQVVLNILDNAIKYTQRGEILIELKKKDNYQQIKISDTGEGMTEDEIKSLFQTFSRASAGIKHHLEGVGIGLYIAKKFIEMHQGKIWVKSSGTGKGSTFYIKLPQK
jgi:signal transduction histidine kinase